MQPYYDDGQCAIYLGDNIAVIEELRLTGVDLVFTSPPYNLGVSSGGGFASYRRTPEAKWGKWSGGDLADGYDGNDDAMPWPEYTKWQQDTLRVFWSTLSDTGAIFWNHKPRIQNAEVILPTVYNPGLPLRQVIIWARAGGVNYAPTHYCPTHEWILVLAKPDWRLKSQEVSGLGDVWRVTQEPSKHPAPFPVGLPARAIDGSAPKLVLDPYVGSGSTLVAAKQAGVPRAVGIEKVERYAEMAVARLNQTSLFSEAAPNGEQAPLFAPTT